MIVSLITEFTVSVFDRGIPNQERIVLYVNESLNLGQYGLMIGVRGQAGMAVPIRDNMLWFGDGIVNKGDWIFIYTGPGEAKTTMLPNTEERLFSIHWGRKETILHHRELVPILFRVDAVIVPQEMENLPKIAP
ncbi:MAG: hypothetical protein M0P73_09545 [Syntrophobacterales bacterium]|jgi:hypothetical protein|nr:hypothetical protein [Syntrophobacterales bacterium]